MSDWLDGYRSEAKMLREHIALHGGDPTAAYYRERVLTMRLWEHLYRSERATGYVDAALDALGY